MDKSRLTHLNIRLSILFILCFTLGLAQKNPDLEGEYIFEGFGEEPILYIFDNNKFLILLDRSPVKGKIEIKNDNLSFIVDHPNPEFILYGRNSLNRRVIFNGSIFRYGFSFGEIDDKNNEIVLNEIEKRDYCRSGNYFLPLENKTNNFIFQSKADSNSPTFFKTDKKYNEFLSAYLLEDDDISLLNSLFSIKENKLVFDNNYINKKTLNKENIKDVLTKINLVDSFYEQEIIFLDQDYEVVLNNKIDFTLYLYDKLNMKYIKKNSKKNDGIPSVLYEFIKINPLENTTKIFENSTTNLIAKCLETPSSIMKQKEESQNYNAKPKPKLIPIPDITPVQLNTN